MAESMALLPEDLLLEILYRLPVKTLIRFTIVCKQWLSLIRSPQFATKQLLTTESNLLRDNFQYFFTIKGEIAKDGMTHRLFASLFSYKSGELSARFEFSPCWFLYVSDPCHGIFCVHVTVDCGETTFLLWNPSIRQVELLPFPLPPYQQDGYLLYVHAFGFGYDPNTDDYKVFVIFASTRPSHGLHRPVGVYSLREGYWKFLPTNTINESICCFLPRPDKKRLVLNGKMCNWLSSGSLISFDLADELIFIKTPFHECWKQQAYFGRTLLQTNKVEAKPRVMWFHDTHSTGDMYSVEIWELVEYGPLGCWRKQIVIEFPLYKWPLGYWKDGEALIMPRVKHDDGNYIVIDAPLLAYDSITKELKSTVFEHALEFFEGVGYIESLVSVKELCRHHNQHQHQPQYDSYFISNAFSVREVNAPTSPINSFPSYCIEWFED